ncbi:MAG TPA: DUF1631 family protein [Thiobacillus sp.]
MAHSPSGAVSNEKRRFARQPTLQTARIRFGEGAAIPSEIRDYCQTGLYVAVLGEGIPDSVIPVLMGTPVQVEFAVQHAGVFVCNGRVARIAPGGVGVLVTAMPEGALQALRDVNGRLARANFPSAGSGLSPQLAHELLLECDSLFRHILDAALEDFFQQAVERLAEASQDEPTFLERSRYDNAIQELLQQRSRVANDFFAAMRDHIQQPGLIVAPSSARAENSLALVEEDEFEDWLNLSAVINQIEEEVVAPLHEVGQRYGRLIGMPVDRKSNPFGPEVICRTFQGVMQGLGFSNATRAVLYKALGQAVSLHAPVLYRQLNETLESLKPVAALRPDRDTPAEAKLKPAPTQTALDLAEIANTLNALFKQNQAGIAQTPESAEYGLDRILATLGRFPKGVVGSASGVSAARSARQGGAVPGAIAAWPGLLHVVGRLQQTARQLVDRDPQVSRSDDPGRASVVLPETSLSELLIALDSLPSAGLAEPGMPLLVDQLNARIAADGPDARRLSPAYRQILDTTSNLFRRAQADFVPSSDVDLLVKRLERPLLKLALQDPGFPSVPDHPARQMLNIIEQYAVAADDQGRIFDAKLQRFLSLLVDRVCDEADTDSGIFERVRDTLEKVLLPILQIRRTRVARLQEACEGRERIRSARARVNAVLEQQLAGREIPGLLLRLLDAGWRQYLVLLEMRQGEGSEAWNEALAILDRVFDCLGPAPADTSRSAESAQALLGEIERALATVNVDTSLLAAFMDELGASLAGDPARSLTGSAMVQVPPGRLATLPSEGEVAPAHRQLADRLRVGDWWDFSQDGSRVPMQLIWISQPPSNCTFANRSATSKADLTLAELSRKIQHGLAKPGKDLDLPLIERSEQALFDDTYQSVVHQAMHDPVTGLLNRKGFLQRLGRMTMPDQTDRTHAVGIIEFDQFRMIVNTCGVEATEKLARNLVSEVRAHISPDAVLAAFRDDTLALLLPNCSREAGYSAFDSLLDRMKDYPFQHGQHSYSIGFNIGITEFAPDRFSAAEAIRRADSACITAKSQGRNRVQVYEQASPQLQSQESLMDWAGRIDSFLKGSGLHLRCQQVMPIGMGNPRLPYYEVLLGIEGADGVEILPAHFIPAVERLQRAHEVDIWVMRNVFEWIAANKSDFASVGGFAINLSATSLSNPEVMRYLQAVLPVSDFPTDKIIFEITESAAIESYGAAQDFIREIRRYGCKFSLDDFGSGFTSYAHLKNLRTDTLKIDGSFVRDMLQNPGDFAMVKSMNDIGHSLGLLTVAEYVESPTTLEALREIGVDYVQGYAIHRPCRIDEILSAQAA